MTVEPGKFSKIALVAIGLVVMGLVLVNLYSGMRKLQQTAERKRGQASTLEHLERPVPAFSLTDQNGKTLDNAELLGKVWAASFIFTHCQGPCPTISLHMAELQKEVADLPDVRLVSFTLDPARDTPAVLKEYGARFRADGQRWFFLTGPEDVLQKVVQEGFLTAQQPAPGSDQIIHGTRVALVDRRGMIRGFLSGTDADVAARAAARLRELHQEKP